MPLWSTRPAPKSSTRGLWPRRERCTHAPREGSRLKRNGGNPPRARQGFVKRDRVRCPACEDREALRNDGGPKIIGGGQLNGATWDVGLTTAAAGCEVCQGRGWLEPTDQEARDPYSLPLTPEQAARMRSSRT